ncbi:MAG TPA: biopolymer transporter ExbD [Coleofasciculaceae cyanobacterium]|jgi:biopolymer transport protein ExbD/biopolymer transport protein TolR
MHTGNRKQIFNEINITPLTDIFLVLLIIMMVVAPMMQQVRQDIKPPQLSSGSAVEQNKLTVEITGDGTIYVQSVETKPEQLAETLKQQQDALTAQTGAAPAQVAQPATDGATATPAAEEKNLIIRADKTTKSGQVLKIFEAARDAGFTKVTVAGDALSAQRQDALQESAGPMSSEAGGME